MREMKRHNFQLQSKIKYLEHEIESLNEKLEASHKERVKLRKELTNLSQLSSGGGGSSGTTTSLDLIDVRSDTTPPPIHSNSAAEQARTTTTTAISSSSRTLSTEVLDKTSFKSSSLNLTYWNELNTSSSWDVNYNTGRVHKYALKGDNGQHENGGLKGKAFNGYGVYIGSIASDLNAIINTPRSYR